MLLTAISLTCLGAGARAASIETLVMPGPLTDAHADLEENCSACHDLFAPAAERGLCLDCHERVAADVNGNRGYHGLEPAVASGTCRQCHTEHQGREADIVGLKTDLFDHSLTDFPLSGAHVAASCTACHQPDQLHAEAPSECASCHEADDVHDGRLGSACADCHDDARWRPTSFDHDSTDFPLLGKHADTVCLACHADARFEAAGTQCVDCHGSLDPHEGRNGSDCGSCHGSTTWEARFDHAAETGFALEGAHAALTCQNCHLDAAREQSLPTDCIGCHSADDVHLGRHGSDCASCHDQQSWKSSFDHEAETGFALAGGHASLTCSTCHRDGLEAPLPTDCADCHKDDDPHSGNLGACERCHDVVGWNDGLRFSHELADFALVGLHRVVSCEQCHASLAFEPIPHSCSDCHGADDVHDGSLGNECESCHNPVDWTASRFDHEALTGFALTGSHDGLACSACHGPGEPADRASPACVTCHRSDDVHQGRFGQTCDRCHQTTDFAELKRDL